MMNFKAEPLPARTLSWWHSERDTIDMSPAYQREGKLWSTRDKAFLIDSILNGYDIPKIYLADFRYVNTLPNKHRKQFAVIDGRQRLEALFAFFDDDLKLNSDFVWLDDRRLELGGKTYKQLRESFPSVASRFDNYNLSVVGVVTDDAARINELFVRLNRGKPLTGAEIRNAMEGAVPAITRTLANHRFFKSKVGFASTRGRHLNAAGKLLLIEFRGKFVDTRKRPLDLFVDEAEEIQNNDLRGAQKRAKSVLDVMTRVFDPNDPLLRTEGPLTVYYWLCREYPMFEAELRKFLLTFNEQRVRNRKLRRPDPELAAYDRLYRSTNDQRSMQERFNILERRFLAS